METSNDSLTGAENLVTEGAPIDLERLFKLRVAVGRIGEMDRAKWWNTQGQLGPLGAAAIRRGFPRTHCFAQASSVFAVASHRCAEVFNPPGSITLWRLPIEVEDAFDARWEHWLDSASEWSDFFGRVAGIEVADLRQALQNLDLIDDHDLNALAGLKIAAEGRAVPIPAPFRGNDADITLLALGFSLGQMGAVSVPYTEAAS